MFWADKIAKEIVSSGKFKPYWVDDMTTPSGFSHIGSIRGPLIHDLIFRVLKEEKKKVINTYVFNDFDPMDGLPKDLEKRFLKYMGFPLCKAPSSEKGFESFGDYFAKDFTRVLREFGIEAEFLSSWKMYKSGKFDGVIRIALDTAEKIQDIYQKVSGSQKKEKGWLPFQVVCEKCGKVGTTRVYAWDDKEVSYKCEPNLVVWAQGCGYEGKISPFGGNGKLPWKVDWPAHWKVIGVTIEGAGKDHASAGGSYDIAMTLCDTVFDYPKPYKLPYEHFLIGGKKMSSSKGLGLKARDWLDIIPASVGRFLFVRTDYREAIEFNPEGTIAIADLFDEYDRSWQAYISGSDKNLARIFELSQINKIPEKKPIYLSRFRDVANYIQLPSIDLKKKFEDVKGSALTNEENQILKERIKYAKIWLEKFAPEEFKFEFLEIIPKSAKDLNDKQKSYLGRVAELVEKENSPENLQLALYNLSKDLKLNSKMAFSAIYQVLIGKDHGPKAAWLLLDYPKAKVVKRLKEVAG